MSVGLVAETDRVTQPLHADSPATAPTARSSALFERARAVTPGGVNTPVRAFGAVGGSPLFIARADGRSSLDIDGNRYLDFIGSWGPMILGHCHPKVVEAAPPRRAEERQLRQPSRTARSNSRRW